MIDPSLANYYSSGGEQDRLKESRLEKDRTLMILKKRMPAAPAIIIDVGGGAGAYAFPLAGMGYDVHLIDPIPLHIKQARAHELDSSVQLASCTVGEARQLDFQDEYADVVLLLGPLYHLIDEKDRLKAIQEAYRVLKPGGVLFAAGISRYAYFIDSINKGVFTSKIEIIKHEFTTGVHRKIFEKFDFSYLHHPDGLQEEIQSQGFKEVSIMAIEGPVWHREGLLKLQEDHLGWQELLFIIESIESENTVIGSSAHIMAVGLKPLR